MTQLLALAVGFGVGWLARHLYSVHIARTYLASEKGKRFLRRFTEDDF